MRARRPGKDEIHHDVAGEDILAKADARFQEYRRRWEANPRDLDPGDFPLHLDIEVTSLCNLRCPFCATTYSKKEIANGHMTAETFKRAIHEGTAYGLAACKFNFRGEPLLHKQLGDFVRYAKRAGVIDAFMNTNAVLLDEAKARMLIESGLDRLTVSFDSIDKATYEGYRVGACFEEVVVNVERLRRLRDEMGSKTPRIRVQAVMVPELVDSFDAFVEFWKERVDQVSYNDMLDNVPGRIPAVPSPWVCPFPYQRLMVMWDGTITTCYNDHYGKNAMGNVHDVSLGEVWTGRLEPLRRAHIEGRAHELAACGECPLRYREMIKRGEVEPVAADPLGPTAASEDASGDAAEGGGEGGAGGGGPGASTTLAVDAT